jgi:hypothetical protein
MIKRLRQDWPVCLAGALALAAFLVSAGVVSAQQKPFALEFQWSEFADPAAQPGEASGVNGGESAVFSPNGQLITIASKPDGRLNAYEGEDKTGGTAHLRLFDIEGDLIWDKARSRGPDHNNDGRPNNQPSDGEDEIELALLSRDGQYIAAGGEDDKIEVWDIRDPSGNVKAEPELVHTFNQARRRGRRDDVQPQRRAAAGGH